MQIIIPITKYYNVCNKILIQFLIKRINFDCKFIFIVQNNDIDLEKYILIMKPNSIIITIDKLTNGLIDTCLFAKDHLNSDDDLIILNNDNIFLWDIDNINNYISNKNLFNGFVVTFDSCNSDYTYIQTNDDNEGILIKEKEVISNNALTGFYYFSKSKYFLDSAIVLIEQHLYNISSIYQHLIDKKYIITQFKIDSKLHISPTDYHKLLHFTT